MATFRDKNHKLGGVIQGVRGALDLLEDQIKELPEEFKSEFKRTLDVLIKGITRIETQAEELKAISYRFIKPDLNIESITDQIKAGNSGKKILVVEDDEIMLQVMPAYLQKRGFQVFMASEVEKAKAIILNEKPAIVILDLALGESLGGLEILRFIKENNLEGRCIIQTKMDDDEIIKKVEELRPYKILLKPFAMSVLEAQINAVMAKSEV
jgi:two-component system, response regulator, stage 0 sporulation protein F